MRRALALAGLGALLAASLLAGCGGGGGTTTVVTDKEADAEVLNRVLSRELAAVDAYSRVLPLLGGDRAMAARFRAQEQEHADAILKALRGLGARSEPEDEEIESDGLRSRADALDFLYEVESVSIDGGLRAISNLTMPWPRSLMGSIVANQAQRLALLRRALGARPLEAIPEAFENGTAPPPGEKE